LADVRKIKSGLVKFPFDQFIGEAGNLFFDPDTGNLFLSDGVTPGGIPVGGGGGGGGGDVSKFGTPVNDQLAVWRNSTTIEGDTRLTWNGTNFAITGNIVVSGTVDGRDISADGSKLDTIQSGATDDQTGAEITSSLDAYLGGTAWRTPGITDLSGSNTDDLAEGSTNLYFTNERVDDRVNSLLVEGSNIVFSYDDVANTLTISSPTAVSLTGQWRFDSTTTMANPGNGDIRLNNAVMASVTQIAIAELSNSGVDTQNYLATLRVNDTFYLQDEDDATKFGRFVINAPPTDNGTWWQLSVTHVNSGAGGTPSNNQICRIAFLLNNGGGSASAMSDLTDVDLTGLSNNDILVYDSVSATWKPEPNSGGSGGTAFMPQVDLIDDTNGTYYYFGWVDGGNGYWQINRQTRNNALIGRADIINNTSIANLGAAWPLRAGLTYS